MEAVDLARRALQECFSRSLHDSGDESPERQDRILASGLRKTRDHFGDAAMVVRASNLPLDPYCPSLPLALAASLFAGARGLDYPLPPDSCSALIAMGADPFASSELPTTSHSRPGRYIFASERLNAFEIALAQSDGGLILAPAPLMSLDRFEPQHWIAYSVFCDFSDPLASLCDQALRSFAERGLLMSCIEPLATNPALLESSAVAGKGRKHL